MLRAYTLTHKCIHTQGQHAYAAAGGVAEETLGNMRTVSSLVAEQRQSEKYNSKLQDAYISGKAKTFATATGLACIVLIIFSTYALALWYGAKLVTDKVKNEQTGEPWKGGDVLTVFFSVMMGAMTIAQMAPAVEVSVSV
jgi:ATP-binding cassette subfamily B (MDR/TAP) protein 1